MTIKLYNGKSFEEGTVTEDEQRPKGLEPTMGVFSGTAMVIGLIIGSGIFSTPASIWQLVGSPGMAMIMWLFGGLITYFGALSYIELGTMLPKSGGEQAYLDYAFKKPKALLSFIFCWSLIVCIRPGSGAANSTVFGKYAMFSIFGPVNDLEDGSLKQNYEWYVRCFGLLCISFITSVNMLSVKWALRMHNTLTSIKVIVLLIISIAGLVIIFGGAPNVEKADNWDDPFAGTKFDLSSYSTVFFKLYWAYGGWNNLNFSLGELKNPKRNLPIAAISGVTIVTVLFILANVAYFTVVPASVAFAGREILAASFVNIVFGPYVGRVILPACIALSAFGAVSAMTFAVSRVIYIAACEGYMPGSRFFARLSARGTPVNALLFNWCAIVIMMFVPPPGEAFDFLIDMVGYPQAIVYGTTIFGLLWLRRTEPDKERPVRVWWPLAAFFVLCSIYVAIFPFIPPSEQLSTNIPYYLSPLLGALLMLLGLPLWYIMLPHKGSIKSAWNSLFRRQDSQELIPIMGSSAMSVLKT
jgi:amino acid transporter